MAAGNDNLFRRLSDVIARPDLAGDPRFRTNKDRVVNRAALIGILDDIFVELPKAVWQQRLDAAGIPNGPLQTVDQVVADPQTTALGIIQELATTPSTRIPLSLVGLPLSFDGVRPPFAKAAPALGEDLAALADEP
jgi:crotonobetainyl-CoA:carnitine CoA-transferase CaiB-like acyl-CoA transferase